MMHPAKQNRLSLSTLIEERTGDSSLTKALNRARLLHLLRKGESTSRASLAKEASLTKVTVSSQVAALLDLGIVKETGAGTSDVGRKPTMLELDGSAGTALGLSLSTQGIHAITMDMVGTILRDEVVSIETLSPTGMIDAIAIAIKKAKLRSRTSRYGLVGVGIAVPGAVESGTGHVVRSAKLDWTDVALAEMVSRRYHGPLHIGNNATLATIAERERSSPEADDFVCLLIDEGIGSGAYLKGAIQEGHNGRFGEVGHMTIVHNGPRCPCGNIGCWDLYGSELALRQALGQAKGRKAFDGDALLTLATKLPAWSRAPFEAFTSYLVTGIINITNAIAPSILVVNSGVLSASPYLFDLIRQGVEARSMAHVPPCELRLSNLGHSAPALGAAMTASERFFETLVLSES